MAEPTFVVVLPTATMVEPTLDVFLPTATTATPTTFSYRPIIYSFSVALPSPTSSGGGSATQSSGQDSSSSTSTSSSSVTWYNTRWRDTITYMLLVYLIASAFILIGMFAYGHLDRRLDFHLSTRSHRRQRAERQRRWLLAHDFPSTTHLQDRGQIGPTPHQRRSSVSTEMGEDSENQEILNIQREWAARGVHVSYDELRQQPWVLARISQRPHFPPGTSSRRDLQQEARVEEGLMRREASDQQLVARVAGDWADMM